MANEIIKELVTSTGADPKLAKLLLEFTGGDLEGAKKIMDAVTKNIGIIKIRFIAQKTNWAGTLMIFYNLEKKEIEKIEIIIEKNIEASKIDVSKKWDIVLKEIKQYAETHQISHEMGSRIEENIRKPENLQILTEALTATQEINQDKIKILAFDVISKVTADTNVAIKMELEKIDIFQLYKSDKKYEFEEKEIKEEVPEKKEKIEEETYRIKELQLIVLQTEIVVSPVKGIPISELKPGDQIMVKITDTRDIGIYLNKLLTGSEDTIERKNVVATIREITTSPETESIMVHVEFGPGILGKAYLSGDLKVLTPFSEELTRLKTEEHTKTSPILIIAILTIILIILIILMLFPRK